MGVKARQPPTQELTHCRVESLHCNAKLCQVMMLLGHIVCIHVLDFEMSHFQTLDAFLVPEATPTRLRPPSGSADSWLGLYQLSGTTVPSSQAPSMADAHNVDRKPVIGEDGEPEQKPKFQLKIRHKEQGVFRQLAILGDYNCDDVFQM